MVVSGEGLDKRFVDRVETTATAHTMDSTTKKKMNSMAVAFDVRPEIAFRVAIGSSGRAWPNQAEYQQNFNRYDAVSPQDICHAAVLRATSGRRLAIRQMTVLEQVHLGSGPLLSTICLAGAKNRPSHPLIDTTGWATSVTWLPACRAMTVEYFG
jgi:hypothetical protein